VKNSNETVHRLQTTAGCIRKGQRKGREHEGRESSGKKANGGNQGKEFTSGEPTEPASLTKEKAGEALPAGGGNGRKGRVGWKSRDEALVSKPSHIVVGLPRTNHMICGPRMGGGCGTQCYRGNQKMVRPGETKPILRLNTEK